MNKETNKVVKAAFEAMQKLDTGEISREDLEKVTKELKKQNDKKRKELKVKMEAFKQLKKTRNIK